MDSAFDQKIISFVGSNEGLWKVSKIETREGEALPTVKTIDIHKKNIETDLNEGWVLKAFISNLRYTNREEKTELDKNSKPLGQPEYDRAAFIPLKKSDEWWSLTQDERRKIFEEDSKHIQVSSKYLAYVSRQLHHSRDLGQPFDFLTWFEYSSAHEEQFEELCYTLRKAEEWKYVIRDIDFRMYK